MAISSIPSTLVHDPRSIVATSASETHRVCPPAAQYGCFPTQAMHCSYQGRLKHALVGSWNTGSSALTLARLIHAYPVPMHVNVIEVC